MGGSECSRAEGEVEIDRALVLKRWNRVRPSHRRVLGLYGARGLKYVEIAIELGINEHTVRKYASGIRRELHASSMAHAVFMATKAGCL